MPHLLNPNVLNDLLADTASLITELEEADAARDKLDDASRTATTQFIDLTAQRLSQTEKTAAEQRLALESMSSGISRIQEINESVVLRMLEPITGVFNPNNSREKLAQKLLTSKGRLDVATKRADLNSQTAAAKAALIDANLDLSKIEFAAETGDVKFLATKIKVIADSRISVAKTQSLLLARANDPEAIQKLVDDDLITQRQADVQISIRKSEGFKRQTEVYNQAVQDQAILTNDLKNTVIEDLKDGTYALANPDTSKAAIRTEVQRKQQLTDIATSTSLAAASAKRNQEIITSSDATLAEKSEEGDQVAKEELASRQDAANKQKQQALATEQTVDNRNANLRQQFLNLQTSPTLTEFMAQIAISGSATAKDERGNELQFNAGEVLAALKIVRPADEERLHIEAGNKFLTPAITAMLQQSATALGIQIAPLAEISVQMEELSKHIVGEEAASLSKARADWEVASASPTINLKDANTLRQSAVETIRRVNESIVNRRIASFSGGMKKAATEYLTNSRITNNNTASSALAVAVIANEFVADPIYNAMMQALGEMTNTSIAEKTGGANITEQSISDAIAANAQKDLGRDDIIMMNAVDDDQGKGGKQAIWARPLINASALETYAVAAEKLGIGELGTLIRSGHPSVKDSRGAINLSVILDIVVKSQTEFKVTLSQYTNELQRISGAVGVNMTDPNRSFSLQDQIIMSSINQLLFSDTSISGHFAARMREDITKAVKNTEDVKLADILALDIRGRGGEPR